MADLILQLAEDYFFKPYVYDATAPMWAEDDWRRQFVSLYVFTSIGATIMYLSLASLSYVFLFDKVVLQDPRLLPNQITREIKYTLQGVPTVSFLTVIVFMIELRFGCLLYDRVDEHGWPYLFLSIGLFLFITDMFIYFIHRGLHDIKWAYKYIHKPHHRWLVTTPFASHAFHPMDGFLQGLPYHLFVFMFPFHKYAYLIMFVLVNVWTVSIHDCAYLVPKSLRPFINGAAHHTDHHSRFNYNYGQYFTLWDRIGGSYRDPDAFTGEFPSQAAQKKVD